MRKHFITIVVIIFIMHFNILILEAHPGNTDAYGCHTCRTNCSKWG